MGTKLSDVIKKSVDLADYVRSCGITLKKHGRNDLKGLCPFHNDTNPSLIITPEKGLFNCPACGAGGSVIDFAMKLHRCSISEAMKRLKKEMPATAAPNVAGEKEKVTETAEALRPERANQLLERVISMYEKTFSDVPEGRSYLEKRGITDAGLFSRHRVGYCNGTLTEILPDNGKIRDELRQLGILLEDGRERFTGCVVFPVFDSEGGTVTLYGRYTGSGAKRHVFLPGRPTGLWNSPVIKTYSEIVLVESCIDALSLEMGGISNVVSLQGTNGFSEDALEEFTEQGVNKITLLLDGDEAGRHSSNDLLNRLSGQFSVRSVLLPDGHDPNSYLLESGAEKLSSFLAADVGQSGGHAAPVSGGSEKPDMSVRATGKNGFVFKCGLRNYEIHGLEKGPRKLKATVRLERDGKLHVDTLDFYSARARRLLCQDVARIFDEASDTVESDISRLIVECEGRKTGDAENGGTTLEKHAYEMSGEERKEAEAFGRSPELIRYILSDFRKCGLVGEDNNKLLCYLAVTSRKMKSPLSVLILSSSGAGKTALQDAALNFCPPEDVLKLTSLSGKALFYKEALSLKHKVLALEEGVGAEEASYAIRNLISAGELVIESTIKDLTTGRLTTMENKVEGPTSVFQTTTDPDIDPETRSRFFVLSVDEGNEQTKAILEFQRVRQGMAGLRDDLQTDETFRVHHNFQRLLKPLAVINPYAEKLSFIDCHLHSRRNQPKYLNLINAVAFLRQLQKEVKTCEIRRQAVRHIEVDLEDIRLANRLSDDILGNSLEDMSYPGRSLLEHLEKLVGERVLALRKRDGDSAPAAENISFSRKDIREFTGWANARVHRYLKELVELEYALIESGRNGTPFRYRLAYDGRGKDGKKFMLGLKNVDELKS